MTVTDYVTFLLSVYLLYRGSALGFLNSLIGPFSIIVATFVSLIYYKNTGNIFICLFIGLIIPLLLVVSIKFLIKLWAKASNTEVKPNLPSRIAGAFVSLAWGWIFIIITLLMVPLLPPWGNALEIARDDVAGSAFYSYIAKPLEEKYFIPAKTTVDSPPKSSASDDARSLSQDPRFQKVIQDPDIQSEIKAHDFGKLISNPKIMALTQQIMNDPQALKKIFALYKAQTQQTLSKKL